MALPYSAEDCATHNPDQQTHKYNGKEFDTTHGLNTYDYGARQYNSLVGRWDRIDPLCEKYNNINTMATKTMECRPGYVYHLVAKTDGLYPNVRGGNVHLKAGDTWKIGETINGQSRYTQKYLESLKLKMVPHSGPMTNKYQLWIEEKRQLIKYASQHGSLPPGNKMFK